MNPFSDTYRYDHELDPSVPFKVEFGSYRGSREYVRPDMHFEVHLGIVMNGQFGLNYPDFHATIKPGNIWFTAPWEPHFTSGTIDNTEICLVTVLPDKVGDIGTCSQIPWLLPFIVPPALRPQVTNRGFQKAVLNAVDEMRRIGRMSDSVRISLLWMKFHELIANILESDQDFLKSNQHNSLSLMRVLPAIDLVRKMKNEPVTLSQAAETCQLGTSRFSELFKTAVGISFGRFSLRVRLSGALADVRNSTLSYKEIAENWGFFDQSHFYRVFQQYLGCTPREIRNCENGHFRQNALS